MDHAVVTLPFESSHCPFATFLNVREKQGDAFFFESARAIGEPPSITVIGVGQFEHVAGPAFASLKAREIAAVDSEIPYAAGGIFGCIGYDSIAELEPKLAQSGNLALRSDESNQLLFARDLIVFDHVGRRIHFVGRASKFRDCLEKPGTKIETEKTELAHSRLQAELGRSRFYEGVRSLKEHIRAGDIFQAVLAERFECDIKVKAIDIFTALRSISPAPYSFFFKFGESEFLGASPEALLKVEGGRLRSHPIAGTRPRGANDLEDRVMKRQLERSRKEAAEHLMLVDLARNDLGRVARAGSVRVNYFRTVQKFSNVMHLVSEVDAEIGNGHSAISALGACFPAGTLSGAPKFRAMQLLSEIETVPRGLYGGAVIAFDPQAQRLDSCIAIRSLEVRNKKAILRAGAGIVADSKPEFEYAEIAHKLKPLRQAIAAAEFLQ